jgi:hypothetical protein
VSGNDVGWALVIPKEPAQLINDLVVTVAEINVDNGIFNQLDTKLDAAIEAFQAENTTQR